MYGEIMRKMYQKSDYRKTDYSINYLGYVKCGPFLPLPLIFLLAQFVKRCFHEVPFLTRVLCDSLFYNCAFEKVSDSLQSCVLVYSGTGQTMELAIITTMGHMTTTKICC